MEEIRTNTEPVEDLPKEMLAIPFLQDLNKPEGMKIKKWKTPQITEDNDVIIKVKAFGLNFADIVARKGQYESAPKYPYVPGYEVCGIVAKIGSAVDNVKVGDKVIGGCFNFGGYAQYAKTMKEAVVPLPEGWTFTQGASVLVTFLTAYHCLTQTGYIGEGDRVLIHAAAGGVGLAAVQICKHFGCEIFGTCGSSEKVALLMEKGVQHPINYSKSDFETEVRRITNGEGVDIILDSIGGTYIKRDLSILRASGRVVGMGVASLSNRSITNLFSLVGSVISMSTLSIIDLMLQSKAYHAVNMKVIADQRRPVLQRSLRQLMRLFEQKVLQPDIITELPWEKINEGHAMLENRKSMGKIVMLVP